MSFVTKRNALISALHKAVGLIREFMTDASNFEPKGKIQRERYPSYADSPLMVTGRLRNSITWEVEE